MITINDQIKDEKLQYDINREAAKISALSSGKLHKYEYLTGEDILPSNQQQIVEQTKFTYSPLGKAFDKQIKTIEDQGKKQVDALNTLKSDNNKLEIKNEDIIPESAFGSDESGKELNKIKEIEKNVDREKIIYKTNKHTYDFRTFNTMRTFGKNIYDSKITLEEADESQSDLLGEIKKFNDKTRSQALKKKQIKEVTLNTLNNCYDAREMVLNGFKSKMLLTKSTGTGIFNTDNSKLKVLTRKQMLQRLPIALAQVKAGTNLENLLIEIRQNIYSLYQSKEITKKV